MQQPTTTLTLICCLLAWHTAQGQAPLPTNGTTAVTASWVEWDRTTDHVISAANDSGAAAPRARQLSNGEILLAYHHGEVLGNCGSRVTLRRSRDGGATWYQTQEVDGPGERGFWGFSNPDFIELGHGHMMLVSAARGKADPRSSDTFLSECKRSGLRVRFSENYGVTWSPPRMIAAGRGRVWEPSIVRLPNGELQIFYANESPDLQEEGASQCIEAIRSVDDGRTWTPPVIISEQRNCRTGMPTALALTNGHVVCGQEVVGLATSPWIADTLHGQKRGYYLAQNQYDFGAAPFLARAPDGSTLLAFHSQYAQSLLLKQQPGAWLFSQIYVQHGDTEADHFGPASCPWPPAGARSGAFFPSLMVMNDGTLVAMASFITVRPDRTVSTVVRWVQGRITAPATKLSAGGTGSGGVPSSHAAVEYKYGPPPDDVAGGNGSGN